MSSGHNRLTEASTKPSVGMNLIDINGGYWVRSTTRLCVGLIVLVGAADFFLFFLGLSPSVIVARSFDISREESFGTWLSTSLALFAGLAAAAIYAHARLHHSFSSSLGWCLIALFFIFISLDDAAKLHERLGTAMRIKYEGITENNLDSWFPSWGWQLFVAPFFMAMGAYMLWFLRQALDARLLRWMIFAFALLACAVALDFLEGTKFGPLEHDAAVHLVQLTEEMLEMFGITTFLYIFLHTLNSRVKLFLQDCHGLDQGTR